MIDIIFVILAFFVLFFILLSYPNHSILHDRILVKQGLLKEHEKTKSWYVLYTKSRHEKNLAESLLSKDWTVYCPLKKVVKQWSDRIKVVEETFSPSFIFIQCRDQDRNQVFQNASAVRYLHRLGRPAVVRAEEIQSILEHDH